MGYYDKWFTIPIYKDGNFVNFQKRREKTPEDKKKPICYWYKSGEVYLFNEGILPFCKTVYITEGLVDSILLNQNGLQSVSATGVNTWKNEWFNKFSKIETIYYFADNDKAGLIGARNVANSLGIYRVKIVTFDDKFEKYDVGDFFREYNSKEAFIEWINTHSHYLFELQVVYGKTRDIGKYRKEFAWAR